MPFVERDAGTIVGLYRRLQPSRAEELLADDDPEVVAYRNPPPPTDQERIDTAFNADSDTFKLVRAVVLAINDGTLVTGADLTGAQLKAIIRDHLP